MIATFIRTLLLFSINWQTLPPKDHIPFGECEANFQAWKMNKRVLIDATNPLENGKLLTKDELRKIILPEYLTYNSNLNVFECAMIKYSFLAKNSVYEGISIGPFQMQLKFIRKILKETRKEEIKSRFLLDCKNHSDEFLIDNLSTLSTVENQWQILLMFEKQCIGRKILASHTDLDKLINYYNSGLVNPPKSFFSKIKCQKNSYMEWSNYFHEL
jgi:hypothetical protein